jgi:tetratricopeptide (TPR) repeat protein
VSCVLAEVLAFVILLPSFAESSRLALCLALFFFTLFSLFVLRLYLRSQRPSLYAKVRDLFVKRCKELLAYQEGIAQHHLLLAQALSRMASALEGAEYQLYPLPHLLAGLDPTFRRFSCWWHWEDVLNIRELLIQAAIDEQLRVVHLEPTSLEAHVALANSYVLLSQLYAEPREDDEHYIPNERHDLDMHLRFRESAQKAIEEFHILNEYAPEDPWIHEQLAYSYRDLQMPQEEIKQYEAILRLRPDDNETLFRLGLLYFQLGQNARGLKVYEELRRSHYKKAESLIKFYGSAGFESQALST